MSGGQRESRAQVAAWDLSTLIRSPVRGNPKTALKSKMRLGQCRCYHHNGMKPQTVGRVLGTGLRVAGRIASQRLAESAQAAATAPHPAAGPAVRSQSSPQSVSRTATRTGGSVSRGLGGFFRPFRRVGGILWLEVSGVFFLLPVIIFAPTLWRVRASWAQGPDHRTFWVAACVVALFLYLGVSSFWRAHKRSARA